MLPAANFRAVARDRTDSWTRQCVLLNEELLLLVTYSQAQTAGKMGFPQYCHVGCCSTPRIDRAAIGHTGHQMLLHACEACFF